MKGNKSLITNYPETHLVTEYFYLVFLKLKIRVGLYSYVGQVFVTQKQVRVGKMFQGLLHFTLYNQYQTEGYEFQNLYSPSCTISKHQPLS